MAKSGILRSPPGPADDLQKLQTYLDHMDNPFGVPVQFRILTAQEHGVSSVVITGCDTYLAAKVAKVAHHEIAFGTPSKRPACTPRRWGSAR